MKIQHKNNIKLRVIVTVLLLAGLASGTGYIAYAKHANAWPFIAPLTNYEAASAGNTSTAIDSKSGTNSSDTTYNNSKGAGPSTPSSPSTNVGTGSSATNPQKQTVNVGVTSANTSGSNVEIRAYVNGVIEGTGTCTATLTDQNGNSATGTSQGFVNATSTQCQTISIPKSNVPSGSWKVVVSYSSPTSTGSSPPLEASLQ